VVGITRQPRKRIGVKAARVSAQNKVTITNMSQVAIFVSKPTPKLGMYLKNPIHNDEAIHFEAVHG